MTPRTCTAAIVAAPAGSAAVITAGALARYHVALPRAAAALLAVVAIVAGLVYVAATQLGDAGRVLDQLTEDGGR